MSASASLPEKLAQLASYFEQHGNYIYKGKSPENSSPLYAYLSQQVSRDPDLLALLVNVDTSTTVTNLFFSAVHFLLLKQPAHPLAEFYPDLTAQARPPHESYPPFRSFCLEHKEALIHLVTTRPVQINEVRRCSALALAFCVLDQRLQGQPLALVEIGTSAGLHLLWDSYAYDYGEGRSLGSLSSPVRIVSAFEGNFPIPGKQPFPLVASRVGLDLNPLDVHNEDDMLWLRALLWPEHHDSQQLLQSAIEVARQYTLTLVRGDASMTLPQVIAAIPREQALCIYHSYTLNQVPRQTREYILKQILQHSEQRDLYRIEQEGYSLQQPPGLLLHTYHKGQMQSERLASCESRGRWIKWQPTQVN
ncbi:DUF2332 domain-containing protein [Ktedonobacter robiniae]|uniref:DUF2332 domain-containing protein n=1 Tax=Ktedonobacter robiniae TaxID=2778365 RepID=A0ABQ3V3V4_9CHLR|nr:DUF2332 domain-containing protein [Ktedonobacter robiniae]GHO59839.1 hypothetical protein KSB_83140 [Ktedonobacter robiniae]